MTLERNVHGIITNRPYLLCCILPRSLDHVGPVVVIVIPTHNLPLFFLYTFLALSYDKDNIDPAIIKKLQVFIENPEFMPEGIKPVSSAA